jgi:hypothetical protein
LNFDRLESRRAIAAKAIDRIKRPKKWLIVTGMKKEKRPLRSSSYFQNSLGVFTFIYVIYSYYTLQLANREPRTTWCYFFLTIFINENAVVVLMMMMMMMMLNEAVKSKTFLVYLGLKINSHHGMGQAVIQRSNKIMGFKINCRHGFEDQLSS